MDKERKQIQDLHSQRSQSIQRKGGQQAFFKQELSDQKTSDFFFKKPKASSVEPSHAPTIQKMEGDSPEGFKEDEEIQ